MRRTLAVTAAAVLLAPAPAHAADESVQVSWVVRGVRVGQSDLAVALCEATANPGTSGSSVASTSVSCSVDGSPPESRTLPAGKSYVVVTTVADRPYEVCYTASASFVGASGPKTVITGPTCAIAPGS